MIPIVTVKLQSFGHASSFLTEFDGKTGRIVYGEYSPTYSIHLDVPHSIFGNFDKGAYWLNHSSGTTYTVLEGDISLLSSRVFPWSWRHHRAKNGDPLTWDELNAVCQGNECDECSEMYSTYLEFNINDRGKRTTLKSHLCRKCYLKCGNIDKHIHFSDFNFYPWDTLRKQ